MHSSDKSLEKLPLYSKRMSSYSRQDFVLTRNLSLESYIQAVVFILRKTFGQNSFAVCSRWRYMVINVFLLVWKHKMS